MKNIKVSLRIIALFTVAIFISKIPELYPNFFGDWYCQGKELIRYDKNDWPIYSGCDMHEGWHSSKWHWGYQHYLFFLMGLALSIIQIIDIFKLINKDNETQPK